MDIALKIPNFLLQAKQLIHLAGFNDDTWKRVTARSVLNYKIFVCILDKRTVDLFPQEVFTEEVVREMLKFLAKCEIQKDMVRLYIIYCLKNALIVLYTKVVYNHGVFGFTAWFQNHAFKLHHLFFKMLLKGKLYYINILN